MPAAELDDYRWLTGTEAAGHLAALADSDAPLHRLAEQLRGQLSAARVHLVLELAELRRRAAEKFPAAATMYFTRQSLEQSTDYWVAQYKAARMAGRGPIADLCCGIGGDLLALSCNGPTVGVDRAEVMTLLAQANLHAHRLAAELRCADAMSVDVENCTAWHIDPDRRPQGRRTSRVEAGEPSLDAIETLLARNAAAAVKLAPAAELPPSWQQRAEREWIGRDRQCRQQVVWFGPLAECAGQHRATVVYRDGRPPASITGTPDTRVSVASQIGRYLLEPDSTILAAGLEHHLAHVHQLQAISPQVAYFTADEPRDEALLQQFEVQEVLPLDMKRLRLLLRERGIGQLEIKKRGLPHDPADVYRQLRPQGNAAATLILTPSPHGARAIIARRL